VIYDLVHPQDREGAKKAFATTSSTGVTGVVMRVARPDGTFRWLEVAARTFTLSDVGQQIVSVCRDVTARKLAEEERDLLIGELDAYARTVAHDLKNPIAVIAGYNELLSLERDRLTEEGQDFLSATGRGCEKVTQIIDELLLLASIRKIGKVETHPLDMAKIVEEACQRVAKTLDEARAEILFPEEWPQAIGYAPWLEEVWVNYISNAVKYGGSPPRIALGAGEDGDGKAHFWVRDNGQGLSEEQLGKLFEEFSRIEPTKAEGHGLGLSIVKRIVERLGGEVRVTSQVGQGSSFGFTLPVVRPSESVER
jgi:signal transduction histidine kinase